jgi:lysophospholipase L1-like esterase
VYLQSVLPVDDAIHYTRRNSDISLINAQLAGMAAERGLVYIDLAGHFADEQGILDKKYSYDGLHLNGAGYLLWKDIILDYVNE